MGAPSHVVEPLRLKLPFWRYFDVFRKRPWPFLLDSASDPQKLGRFSFMGAEPSHVFRAKRVAPQQTNRPRLARCTIEDGRTGATLREAVEDPFAALQRILRERAVPRSARDDAPVPLLAGAVGYFGFEAGMFIEALPDAGRDDLALPDIHIGLYDALLAHCHATGISYVSARGPDAERHRDELLQRLAAFEADPTPEWPAPGAARSPVAALPTGAVSEADYCALVDRVKEHVFAGDVFELCLTHRVESPFAGDPWDLYRELRRINPAPFASFLPLPEATIVSSSPERFLKLGVDRIAESRPIKGTRPRGATPEEDRALAEALRTSPKDRAENVMIVDLVRNDFGRVCRFGTVHVPELCVIERYATVHQMVSTIRGQLRDEHDALDLVKACFPGGSMTGAPKIEALKIIDALEPVKRSVYSGAIGYLDDAGTMDLAIVIRTIVLQGERAFYGVGGAVVADSDSRAEYQETLDKANALVRALEAASSS